MTTTYYKITSGPCRDDLLDSLLHGKTVWFRAFDSNTNHPSLFVVRVTKLGLNPENDAKWVVNGLIITKDGKNPGIYKKCKVGFDAHNRRGSFHEVELHERNSYEYFKHLDDSAIRAIIQQNKASMPKELKHLEAYSRTLDPRERLILEAMHVTALSHACMGVEIFHELSSAVYE
jgi:hypothetical protein